MTRLSVNVNKVATLRNTRAIGIPSVVEMSRICLDAGAHGITVHPRPDQRHIRPHDVTDLANLLKSYPGKEFNIEGNPFFEFMRYPHEVRPAQCTLVSDLPEAETSDRGWDLRQDGARLRPIIKELKSLGCRVSLFMNAETGDLQIAREIGADRVEFYTAPYAHAFLKEGSAATLPYAAAARQAGQLGLGVNAGHDLNLKNLPAFAQAVPGLLEVSIGHALIADALEFGLRDTVRRYLACLEN
jgi:pyridoxine 5-phosphate synthase